MTQHFSKSSDEHVLNTILEDAVRYKVLEAIRNDIYRTLLFLPPTIKSCNTCIISDRFTSPAIRSLLNIAGHVSPIGHVGYINAKHIIDGSDRNSLVCYDYFPHTNYPSLRVKFPKATLEKAFDEIDQYFERTKSAQTIQEIVIWNISHVPSNQFCNTFIRQYGQQTHRRTHIFICGDEVNLDGVMGTLFGYCCEEDKDDICMLQQNSHVNILQAFLEYVPAFACTNAIISALDEEKYTDFIPVIVDLLISSEQEYIDIKFVREGNQYTYRQFCKHIRFLTVEDMEQEEFDVFPSLYNTVISK